MKKDIKKTDLKSCRYSSLGCDLEFEFDMEYPNGYCMSISHVMGADKFKFPGKDIPHIIGALEEMKKDFDKLQKGEN